MPGRGRGHPAGRPPGIVPGLVGSRGPGRRRKPMRKPARGSANNPPKFRAGRVSLPIPERSPAGPGRPRAPESPGPRPPPRRDPRADDGPAAESENGAGPICDDIRTIFGNSADRLRPARPPLRARARVRSAPQRGSGPVAVALRTFANEAAPSLHARVRSAPGIGFARRRGLASLGAGDWLRSAPAICSPGAGPSPRGGYSRTKQRPSCTPGFARRREGPGLASLGAADWLRSARGIGFARRRGLGPGSPGEAGRPKLLDRQGHPRPAGSRRRPEKTSGPRGTRTTGGRPPPPAGNRSISASSPIPPSASGNRRVRGGLRGRCPSPCRPHS